MGSGTLLAGVGRCSELVNSVLNLGIDSRPDVEFRSKS